MHNMYMYMCLHLSVLVLAAAAAAPASAASSRSFASLAVGERLSGSVVGRHRDKLFVDVGVERRGRAVAAQLNLPQRHPLREQVPDQPLSVYVRRVDDGRLRVALDPSLGAAADLAGESDAEAWEAEVLLAAAARGGVVLETLAPGDALRGRVVHSAACGVFVDCGVSRRGSRGRRRRCDGLVPLDQLGGQSPIALRRRSSSAEPPPPQSSAAPRPHLGRTSAAPRPHLGRTSDAPRPRPHRVACAAPRSAAGCALAAAATGRRPAAAHYHTPPPPGFASAAIGGEGGADEARLSSGQEVEARAL